jgi:peroxiredoxin
MQDATRRPTRRRPRVSLIIGLPLVAVAAVAFIALVTRPLSGEPRPSFFAVGSAAPGVQIGQVAPGTTDETSSADLALADLGGAALELRDYAGEPIWLIFWKTSCEPCEAEAADVEAAFGAHRPDGLVILAIDVWDTAAAVRDYVADHPLSYPIAIPATADLGGAYGVWGAPTHYFIGADRIIRDRYFGPMTRDMIERSLQTIIEPAAPQTS